MKRFIAYILTAVLVFSLTGCALQPDYESQGFQAPEGSSKKIVGKGSLSMPVVAGVPLEKLKPTGGSGSGEYTPHVSESDTYENPDAGFGFKLGNGWAISKRTELAEVMGTEYSAYETDEELAQYFNNETDAVCGYSATGGRGSLYILVFHSDGQSEQEYAQGNMEFFKEESDWVKDAVLSECTVGSKTHPVLTVIYYGENIIVKEIFVECGECMYYIEMLYYGTNSGRDVEDADEYMKDMLGCFYDVEDPSYAENDEGSEYLEYYSTSRVYENSFSGIEVSLDNVWTVMGRDSLAGLSGLSKNDYGNAEILNDRLSQGEGVYEYYAVKNFDEDEARVIMIAAYYDPPCSRQEEIFFNALKEAGAELCRNPLAGVDSVQFSTEGHPFKDKTFTAMCGTYTYTNGHIGVVVYLFSGDIRYELRVFAPNTAIASEEILYHCSIR